MTDPNVASDEELLDELIGLAAPDVPSRRFEELAAGPYPERFVSEDADADDSVTIVSLHQGTAQLRSGFEQRARSRRMWIPAAAAAAVVAITATGLILQQRRDGGTTPVDAVAPSGYCGHDGEATEALMPDVVDLDPIQIEVGAGTAGVATGAGAVWVTSSSEARVLRIDPGTNRVDASVDVGESPESIAASDDAVWVTHRDSRATRIDPSTGSVVATVDVGGPGGDIAITDEAVWITNFEDATVSRIDSATNRVVAEIGVGENPTAIAATRTAVWVANYGSESVATIDPRTNSVVDTIDVGAPPSDLVADQNSVWMTFAESTVMCRIDPTTSATAGAVDAGSAGASHLLLTPEGLFATNVDGLVLRFDSASGDLKEAIRFQRGNGSAPIAIDAVGLWVLRQGESTLYRLAKPEGDATKLADRNQDGVVDCTDVYLVADLEGSTNQRGDVNIDGKVDTEDLSIVLSQIDEDSAGDC